MLTGDILDKSALFSDETCDYRIPPEPEAGEDVTIRFRTYRDNADCVYLIARRMEVKMRKANSTKLFDFYEATIKLGKDQFLYYFEIDRGSEICFFNKLGCTGDLKPQYSFKITPGFHAPQWAKGAVIYQIFTDRFCNGDPNNDVLSGEYYYVGGKSEQVEEWDSLPANLDIRRFYGGDLQGVRKKLDYLQNLGVEVIYFNPLFVSPSNHKYDIQDYDYIDPHLTVMPRDNGELLDADCNDNKIASRYIDRVTSLENLEASNAYFADFMKEIHSRGMRVILDGVFNHCGSFNKWLDRELIYEKQEGYEPGAFVSENSPYHKFFKFKGGAWPYNSSYEGWWDHETLPKLNYEESPELYEYIMGIGRKWVSEPYSIDGWRLDVAADLGRTQAFNHRFWRDFRKSVKAVNPEAIILAEHYGNPSSWMQGDQWDTVMNYDAFMEPVTWFLTGMEKHSDEFQADWYGNGEKFFYTMNYNMSKFQRQSLDVAMNELSNHDHSRFLTRTNRRVGRIASCGADAASEGVNKGVLREAVVIQMTWPGAPTIYYGDEAGMTGWTDPDNRRTYPWGSEDWELIEFHKEIIRIHKSYACLKTGSYKQLGCGSHWIAYGRFDAEGCAAVLVNNRDDELEVSLPVWQLGIEDDEQGMLRVMQSTAGGYNVGELKVQLCGGMLNVKVGPKTASVYVYAKK